MMLVSYRTRGSDAPWHAGIAHEGTVVDVTRFAADEAPGQGDLSVRELLEQGPSSVAEVFDWAESQFETRSNLFPLDILELGPPVPNPDKISLPGCKLS